jgi:DNA-binding CsgD family transcriptional regulator
MDELRDFMGTGFDNLVEVGTRVGFVEVNADRLEVHPLLRDFLEQQLRRTKFDSVVDSAVTALAAAEVWDEAFDVAVRFDSNKTLPKLVERAWQPLLEEGKLTTLARWISVIRTRHLTSDSVDLAEAQVALRQGRSQTAEFLALRVARTSTVANQKANAYSVAGSAAHIASKSRAFDHYAEALNLSSDLRITRQAKIGQFLSALEFQPERAQELFNGLENALDADPTTSLRLLAYRVMYERRTGNLRAAMALAEAGEGLLGQVDDPMARTAYLHSLAFGYSELASYDRARRTAVRLIDEGSKYRLPFAVSYGNFVFAIASLGLRQFKQGLTACEQAGSQARELGLAYGELNAKILMSRIRLAMGDWSRARALFDIDIKRSPLPALTAEFTMASAFLSAVIGDETRARRLLSRRAGLFLDGLVMSLRDATEAVIATRSSDHEKAANHLEHILGRGQLDTLVSTFRAEPETLVAVRHLKPWQDVLRKVLLEARESELGRRYGILESKDVNRLISRREMEVLGLLAQGLRNKEIGERLFISEVTVKAHLRRIFRVLGVSTRTQAVIASAGVLDQATPAADSANGEASDSDPN